MLKLEKPNLAALTGAVRLMAPSLPRMVSTWVETVRGLVKSASAMAGFECPAATSVSTSISRTVSRCGSSTSDASTSVTAVAAAYSAVSVTVSQRREAGSSNKNSNRSCGVCQRRRAYLRSSVVSTASCSSGRRDRQCPRRPRPATRTETHGRVQPPFPNTSALSLRQQSVPPDRGCPNCSRKIELFLNRDSGGTAENAGVCPGYPGRLPWKIRRR